MRRMLHLSFVAAALATGCNPIFGIHEGTPRPMCADSMMIDDMEDGDGFICALDGRNGHWYTVGDGTAGAVLIPPPDAGLDPTRITDGKRGSSQYAAHFTGSGFTRWGALMGFNFNDQGQGTQTISASSADGIRFWMKSNVPISVQMPIPETVSLTHGGACSENATERSCNNDFSFQITAPNPDWFEYSVPFDSLSQYGGSATWNPQKLLGIHFAVPRGAAFDLWIDDIRFYRCPISGCVPTCTDPAFPVECQATDRGPGACWPPETDCAVAAGWCAEPLIDDMEDGNGTICDSDGRRGWWYSVDDGTSTDLTPPPNMDFVQTAIPGGRTMSNHAARLTGSGFTGWGALMGFGLNVQAAGNRPYDASPWGGITFLMKSNVAVAVNLPISETVPSSRGGRCEDNEPDLNCDNHFTFRITAPSSDWVEYKVPFAALSQQGPGSATWDPSHLLNIDFQAQSDSPFNVWVDDIRFYTCAGSGCLPTCADPAFSAQCRPSGRYPARCRSSSADCVPGCNDANTVLAPADGLIATFVGAPDGTVDIQGDFFSNLVPVEIADASPTRAKAERAGGVLRITLDAPAMSALLDPVASPAVIASVADHFAKCVDATAFSGVQFSISGSVSGCVLNYFTEDSAHIYDDGSPRWSHGTGVGGSRPLGEALAADQVTSIGQTVSVPFTALSGASDTPFEKAKITGVGWRFFVDAFPPGLSATPCVADLTIDDVRFY